MNEVDEIQRNMNENINHNIQEIGPMELNLLDKIEEGLKNGISEQNSVIEEKKNRYSKKKKIIKISGFVNINNVFNEYVFFFLCKIFLILLIIIILNNKEKKIRYDYFVYSLIIMTFILVSTNIFNVLKYNKISKNIRNQYLLDFLEKISLIIFFVGLLLFIKNIVKTYLFLFIVPHFICSIFFWFLNPFENEIISKNKFIIIETFQYILISIKLCFNISIPWFYFFFYFYLISFFMILIGIMLFIISIFSFYGYLNNYLSGYKSKLISKKYNIFNNILPCKRILLLLLD